MNKRDIISIVMMICFIVAYLPVTSSWYISVKGRLDLSRLVMAATTLNAHIDKKTSEKKLARSIDIMFNELKFATGKIKVEKGPEKSEVLLTEILPEFPLIPKSFRIKVVQRSLYNITDNNNFYQSISLFVDPPPPKNKLYTLPFNIYSNISC